jgi:hypothetical protein
VAALALSLAACGNGPSLPPSPPTPAEQVAEANAALKQASQYTLTTTQDYSYELEEGTWSGTDRSEESFDRVAKKYSYAYTDAAYGEIFNADGSPLLMEALYIEDGILYAYQTQPTEMWDALEESYASVALSEDELASIFDPYDLVESPEDTTVWTWTENADGKIMGRISWEVQVDGTTTAVQFAEYQISLQNGKFALLDIASNFVDPPETVSYQISYTASPRLLKGKKEDYPREKAASAAKTTAAKALLKRSSK